MPVEFANESAVLLLAMREFHAFRVKFSRMARCPYRNFRQLHNPVSLQKSNGGIALI
jgi:hypothetical protein